MILQQLSEQVTGELDRILDYWVKYSVDPVNGGFVGRIDEHNCVVPGAAKGAVLNARLCWTFSAVYQLTGNETHKALAARAFDYICRYFLDPVNGGVYWSVDATGNPLDDKKQVYALSFTLYAFAEYYKLDKDPAVLESARQLYGTIKSKSYDPVHGGYFEAFTRDWHSLTDLRLSSKDANEAKTMNTHLHLLEAFTNLYRICPDETLARDIRNLLHVFSEHFIDRNTGHLRLFFDEAWNSRSTLVSYGHDIEASWLLLEAAEVLKDDGLMQKFRGLALRLVDAAMEGFDRDGGLWYEYDPANNYLVKEKHWWPQAEALVGLFKAWQLGMKVEYLEMLLLNWAFIQGKIADPRYGDWIWGVDGAGLPMKGQDKLGIWKCPYHNVRACLVLMTRV